MRLVTENGSAFAVFILILAPAVSIVLVIVNVFLYAGARRRADLAAKRAAFAGAAAIAYGLNEMLADGWKWHKKFERLQDDLEKNSDRDEDTAKNKINHYWKDVASISEDLMQKNNAVFSRAAGAAEEVLSANLGMLYEYFISSNGSGDGGLIKLSSNLYADQIVPLDYDYIMGGNFMDPFGYSKGHSTVVSYLAKPSGLEGLLRVQVERHVQLPTLARRIEIPIRSEAWAMAYGGSFRDFSNCDADEIDDAQSACAEHLYKPALIWRIE